VSRPVIRKEGRKKETNRGEFLGNASYLLALKGGGTLEPGSSAVGSSRKTRKEPGDQKESRNVITLRTPGNFTDTKKGIEKVSCEFHKGRDEQDAAGS